MYDLVIAGGTLVDPAQGVQERKDVAVDKGRIIRIAKDIPREEGWDVLDASGHIVTPGLIDLHVHVYPGVSHYGIHPDPTCLARGVTTVCDAGSSGADTFEGLKRYIIEVAETRVLAFLNISTLGMISPENNELEDLKHANPERAISVCERNRDVIQGVKVRLARKMVGNNGIEPLRLAKRAAAALGMPLMVHVGDTPSSLGEILEELRPGDLVTHCFHGLRYGVLDEKGDVLTEVWEAARKGIIFDVGHGRGSFSFAVARKALKVGLVPGTISSDLHFYNVNGPVFDLATTMSKFMLLGLPLAEVLARTTSVPARLLGLSDRLGSLQEGYLADITVFKITEGDFEFEDTMGVMAPGRERLEPVAVIRGGKVYRSQLPLDRKVGRRW
jgi:dihydroorotase